MLKLIVCVDQEFGIAKNGQLPWHIPSEMQHFKKTTLHHPVVMGHQTFLSMGGKLLPQRKNIIFSRNPDLKIKGALVTHDVTKILKWAKREDVFLIGGKQIYELFFDYCDELIISQCKKSYECDVFFQPYLKYFVPYKVIPAKEYDITYYRSLYHKILDGKKLANEIVQALAITQQDLVSQYHVQPHLVIVQVGNLPASNLYIKNKMALADKINIQVTHLQLPENISQSQLITHIQQLNADANVHGILVQAPLPPTIDMNVIANTIDPLKDVDCFHAYNAGKVFRNEATDLYPCTPSGVMALLQHYQIPVAGKHVVILGRSNIVTKPLAMMLLHANATVTICHSQTKNLGHFLKQADIICSAAGKAHLIKAKDVKKNAVVIDIAMNYDEEHRLCGDVDFDGVIKKVQYLCPVPRGIGPLTLAMLFKNLLLLTRTQLTHRK